jgi:hypothetical protein
MTSQRRQVDVYCEDVGHESLVRALLERLGRQEGVSLELRVQSGRGGKGKALREFEVWQRQRRRGAGHSPDLLVVVIDANCQGWNAVHSAVESKIDLALHPAVVVGCPDPHLERWLMADPVAFERVVGKKPRRDPGKCDRAAYKRLLEASLSDAGAAVLTGPMEYAPELIAAMDLFAAGKRRPELRQFAEALTSALRRMRG